MTIEQAKNFRMPFGKHKGQTLYSIEVNFDNLQYIEWIADTFDPGKVRDACETYLSASKEELEAIDENEQAQIKASQRHRSDDELRDELLPKEAVENRFNDDDVPF